MTVITSVGYGNSLDCRLRDELTCQLRDSFSGLIQSLVTVIDSLVDYGDCFSGQLWGFSVLPHCGHMRTRLHSSHIAERLQTFPTQKLASISDGVDRASEAIDVKKILPGIDANQVFEQRVRCMTASSSWDCTVNLFLPLVRGTALRTYPSIDFVRLLRACHP